MSETSRRRVGGTSTIGLVIAILFFLGTAASGGVPGIPDQVPAATLLVPFVNVGVDAGTNSDDTLLVITNTSASGVRIHYEVWTVRGERAELFDNVLLDGRGTLPLSMRALILAASPGARAALEQGDFYRGFVTIDAVTAVTTDSPLDGTYPFRDSNVLTGWIYYARLLEGSANGLPMVHIEAVSGTLDSRLRDFYAGGGVREEIDSDSRGCAETLASGIAGPCDPDDEGDLDEVFFRVFAGGPLSGASRLVLFTWRTFSPIGGPSELCPTATPVCAVEYPLRRYGEDGVLLLNTTTRLDDVVNVIDVPGSGNGWIVIRDVPNVSNDLQVYGFVFNSAAPPDASSNWDAIFEATIEP